MKTLIKLLLLGTIGILIANGAAHAQTFGDIFESVRTSQVGPAASLAGAISFFAGIIFVIIGVISMARKRGQMNGEGMAVGKIVTSLLAGFALIALPELAGVGVSSVFGTGATQASIDGTLRSLN